MRDFEEYRKFLEIDEDLEKSIKEDLARLFTSNEIDNFGKRISSLVCRKLLKDDLMKALEAQDAYQEIEILANEKGKPEMTISESLKNLMIKKGFTRIYCSLSHSFNAVATLLILDKN